MCDNIIENSMEQETVLSNVKPIERFDITAKDTVFAIIFTVCSVVMSSFGIFGGFRSGFTVSALMLLVAVTAYFKNKEIKIGVYSAVCFILSIGLSVNFSVTSNSSVRFWSFVLLFLLMLIWFTSLISNKRIKGDLGIIKEIFIPIFKLALPNLPNSVASLLSGRKNKTFGRIILGIIPAIPVLFVVVPLLMSSDEAFSGMISLATENIAALIFKLILGTIISVFVIAYCLSLKKKELPEIKSSNFKGLESTAIISFLSVISVCYLSYLFSQLAYFFSAFSGFLPEGYEFSVSGYARRGFFEMSIIAAINFIIIFAALLLSGKKNGRINIVSRIICTFIGVFTLIIIATALSKMFLYIKSFGMTELRITTSAFMIFLAVVFVSLMIRLYVPSVKVIKTGFIAAAVTLVLLGTVNVNSVIAEYNYTAYKKGVLKEIDVSTIYNLGDEGVPYLAKLAGDKKEDVAQLAKLKISYSLRDYYETEYNGEFNRFEIGEKKYTDIGEFSFSRQQAYAILDSILEENPELLNYSNDYHSHDW